MKTAKLIIGIILLLALGYTANAQSWDGTHIYTPQYTKHFSSHKLYHIKENGSEGGSEGFLVTRSSNGLHFTMGIMENSYGDFSKYAMFGVSIKETKRAQLSAHAGIADGYDIAYYDRSNSRSLYKYLGETMADERFMPLVSLTYKHRITRHIGVQFNVSPVFVNTGIYVQL